MKSLNLHHAKIFFKCDNLNHFYHILVTKRDFFFLSNFFSVIADYSYQVIIIVELQLQTSLDLTAYFRTSLKNLPKTQEYLPSSPSKTPYEYSHGGGRGSMYTEFNFINTKRKHCTIQKATEGIYCHPSIPGISCQGA